MTTSKPLTGRTVLFSMIGFFAVIFAVNGVFAYLALSSFPGLSTEGAYQKGLAYNQTLADAEKQTSIGWDSNVSLSAKGQVFVQITDPQDTGVSGMSVTAQLMRPARSGLDQNITLAEGKPGQYIGMASPLLAGRWHLQITATQENQAVFYKVHTLMIDG